MCKIIYFQSDVGIQFKWRGRVDTFECFWKNMLCILVSDVQHHVNYDTRIWGEGVYQNFEDMVYCNYL
jgi:hypothetical protein